MESMALLFAVKDLALAGPRSGGRVVLGVGRPGPNPLSTFPHGGGGRGLAPYHVTRGQNRS